MSAAPDVAPLVSGASVMLAAFGFFYNAIRDRIDDALEASETPSNTDAADVTCTTIKRGRAITVTLCIVAVVVTGILTPEVVGKIKAAVENPDLGRYSTIDVIFVAIAFGWLAIAAFFAWRSVTLTTKLSNVKQAKAELSQVG